MSDDYNERQIYNPHLRPLSTLGKNPLTPTPKGPKWEYLILDIPIITPAENVHNGINSPGGDWELFAVVLMGPTYNGPYLENVSRHYYKRLRDPNQL